MHHRLRLSSVIFVVLLIGVGAATLFVRKPTRERPVGAGVTPANPRESGAILPKYCTAPPTTIPIGLEVYPIEPKYSHLYFLGQLLTAAHCGEQRLRSIYGVVGDDYTLGLAIWLKAQPDPSLVAVLKSVGFMCSDAAGDEGCLEWELYETVKIRDLLRLEPYAEQFERDDCRHCG